MLISRQLPVTLKGLLAWRLQFNLELDELEGANKDLEPWKKDVGRPLVLEASCTLAVLYWADIYARTSAGRSAAGAFVPAMACCKAQRTWKPGQGASGPFSVL